MTAGLSQIHGSGAASTGSAGNTESAAYDALMEQLVSDVTRTPPKPPATPNNPSEPKLFLANIKENAEKDEERSQVTKKLIQAADKQLYRDG